MEHVLPVAAGRVRPNSSPVRKSSWVVVGSVVGIANELFTTRDGAGVAVLVDPDEEITHIEFHAVDSVGNTVSIGIEPIGLVRQAAWNEIPAKRRPVKAVAARLGYQ